MDVLLNQIKEGNAEALISLLKELEPKISRIISFKVSNEQDVKDLTQEVMVRIYRHIYKQDESKAKLMTWVTQIAKNLCIDYYRKRYHQVLLLGDDELTLQSNEKMETQMEKAEFSIELLNALDTLSEKHREVFIMRHLHDKSYDEIANKMKLPLNTIKSIIHRSRHTLRGLLSDYKMTG
ncbi:RNA polymerase sigma-70 factor (ECF subfamily) [Paenibacillus sp. 1182]|uniref:RNA polymerase sigma factor n=1 Tax=Paenibacillus sp. 1182 TaxID=2806565 RepID=UPI001AE41884|nr:RNA polymerase sigma factor [Paenibacillus sp. 1182]MBP1309192.1 RNA polymerase sigma-70 factor (ECF subfamily) [Paenibacillus sp. 1182]